MPVSLRRGYLMVAAFVFLSTLAVYALTVTPSIPFWDSGEFIATSYLLGIPHPPGTPLYVIIGRLFAMLPFGNVEWQVNFLSALASAFAVLFTFLVSVRFMRIAQARRGERTVSDEVIAWTAGAVAAFFVAFSNTFWQSAIEAEVYALSSMVQVMAIYLSLRWWEELGNDGGEGRLLLAWYLMCLCIGIHLGTFLVAPAVVLLALLVRQSFWRFTLWSVGVLITAILVQVFANAASGRPGSVYFYGALLALATIAVLLQKSRELFKLYFWSLALLVVGVSVHYYLLIRAGHNPAINEGDPETWDKMMYLLQRKQYGSRPMFPRVAPFDFQIQMFMNYFLDQYRLWPLTGAFASVIPMALGLYGAFMQFVREKKTFLMMACLFGITGFGMVMYLNFTDHEVRNRDYFFTSAFHFFAIWIGLGAGFVLELVRDAMKEPARERVSLPFAGACVAMVALSWLPMKTYFFSHDRRGFYIASDYAHNMLAPLAKDAFVLTNGDNDTFPLWATQAVDKVRQDVRVVNLSLLNTDWYIKQLRDEEPKVPMDVSDEALAQIGTRGYMFDDQGQPEAVNTWMVRNIMRANTGAKARPAYLAVTVPNHMGLDKRLKLEGLVYRVYPDSVTGAKIDTAAVRKGLYDVFHYRGLFTEDGTYLDKPYKDENAYRLTQNYAAAHLQLGFRYRLDRKPALAVAELERILRMYPTFPAVRPALGMFYMEVGDTAKALSFFQQSEKIAPRDADLAYYHGIALGLSGDPGGAVKRLNAAIDLAPDDGQSYFALYSLLFDNGRVAEAADVLKRWLARNPDDVTARRMLESITGPGKASSLAPPGGPGGIVPGGAGLP